MKRMKFNIKHEMPEPSTSHYSDLEEHDLAYYIQDRVELMHQVFSVLKHKDLMAMAPECVRRLSINDLQELCLEELLGISSKRLCAILDGAEPPSDTESSSPSPERLETISLDSISSDDEILSQGSSKKRKKHKHHKRRSSKSKHKNKKSKERSSEEQDGDQTRATRAGLTVLELLELQARARAIRAQLQNEQANRPTSETVVRENSQHSSDNEVEIKEEQAEVVEISSEDEKPKIENLSPVSEKQLSTSNVSQCTEGSAQTVTERRNNLIITVPQSKQSRKIKLNRNKNVSVSNPEKNLLKNVETEDKPMQKTTSVITTEKNDESQNKLDERPKAKSKKKQKKKERERHKTDNEGSDRDEICLQLSDSEKMDLLEDLDRKNLDNISSSGSEDTDSSSSSTDSDKKSIASKGKATCDTKQNKKSVVKRDKLSSGQLNKLSKEEQISEADINKQREDISQNGTHQIDNEKNVEIMRLSELGNKEINKDNEEINRYSIKETDKNVVGESNADKRKEEINEDENKSIIYEDKETNKNEKDNINADYTETGKADKETHKDKNIEIDTNQSASIVAETAVISETDSEMSNESVTKNSVENHSKQHNIDNDKLSLLVNTTTEVSDSGKDLTFLKTNDQNKNAAQSEFVQQNLENLVETADHVSNIDKDLSEGEVSDRESSEVEAFDVQLEVVCISDEDAENKKVSKKKKNKKEKKSKKEKKIKKSKDFREDGDQNFYKDLKLQSFDNNVNLSEQIQPEDSGLSSPIILEDDNSVYEILDLSDDSSCYEVEGVSVLSKEPTTEEIEALSAKIDEIDREDVVTDEQIRKHEELQTLQDENNSKEMEQLQNVSWKDRYLSSRKVKRVLTTSNIFNALRKKNKELKIKIKESKKKASEIETQKREENSIAEPLDEGSIEQYNTLQGSTKYVDPIAEPSPSLLTENIEQEKNTNTITNEATTVSKEMKKDAKQLLKMYKKLLKYNDMNKQKDPNMKKKKKEKKSKKKKKSDEQRIP